MKKSKNTEEWSADEVERLIQAVKSVDETLEKSEKWRQVAAQVGNGRGKKQCHLKYKELKHAKKSKGSKEIRTVERVEKTQVIQETKADSTQDVGQMMMVEDFDEDEELNDMVTPVQMMPQRAGAIASISSTGSGRPITLEEAKQVRALVFGDEKKFFNRDWMTQGFFFSSTKDLGFGLVQTEGGPCGALAVVQGYVLKYLMYGSKPVESVFNVRFVGF